MLTAAIALGGIGLLAALGLGVVAKLFYVHVDPLVLEVEEALPGANCGGCGYAGCSAAAEAIVKGEMAPTRCVGGGAEVHVAVAAIMGVEVTESEPQIAQVGCRYPVSRADLKFSYAGVQDCRAAVVLNGGPKECPIGCIGLGSCVRACPFDALRMGSDGLPVVDEARCTGCGTCVRTCPVGIMKLTSVSDRILGEYTTAECTAPCQRTCPAGIDIPEQIRQTALGDYEAALRVIKERNPLPLICGRICPHPCELECRRNLADEPVAINPLKRFVADWERQSGRRVSLYRAPRTGKRLAVIGGGAEGLTAACYLARLGHSPVVFEALPKLGGLLRTAIPEERLPREVLDWEIEGILETGVEARTGQALGRDFSLSSLFEEGFQAVLIATGGWDSQLMQGPRPNPAPALKNLYLLLPLSLAWASGQEVDLGRRVVVIGGGKAALAAARRCLGQGAEAVTVIWPAAREEMDLSQEELDRAEAEGVVVRFGKVITRLLGQGDRLTGLACRGKGNGHEEVIEAETIIAARARLPEMLIVPLPAEGEESEPTAGWQTLAPYRRPEEPSLFAAEEPVSDYRATVEAIGGGRRAAASLHLFLSGREVAAPERMIVPETRVLNVDSLENLIPVVSRHLTPPAAEEPQFDREAEPGLTEEAAREEARRCLNCGLICYYRTRYN